MTLKRGKIKDYWYDVLCCLVSDDLSTDPPQLPPDPPHVLLKDPTPSPPLVTPLQSSRTMGSLVLEGSRDRARERGGGGSLIRTGR